MYVSGSFCHYFFCWVWDISGPQLQNSICSLLPMTVQVVRSGYKLKMLQTDKITVSVSILCSKGDGSSRNCGSVFVWEALCLLSWKNLAIHYLLVEFCRVVVMFICEICLSEYFVAAMPLSLFMHCIALSATVVLWWRGQPATELDYEVENDLCFRSLNLICSKIQYILLYPCNTPPVSFMTGPIVSRNSADTHTMNDLWWETFQGFE